ncbi:MAG: hypothetical protein O2963_02815, partial [Proteobacteria bacterium]|nr:hypothetical protein [Pseudomonadota bacterium]
MTDTKHFLPLCYQQLKSTKHVKENNMRLSYQLLISLLLPFIWLSHSAFSQESLTSEYKIKSTPTEILGLEQAQKNNAYIDVDQNLTYAIYLPNGYN